MVDLATRSPSEPERDGTERVTPEREGPERVSTVRDGSERDGIERECAEEDGIERECAEEEGADDRWSKVLAETLAFARRRLTGDYEVDEFGFDPQVCDSVVLAALRPLAHNWFRVEVRGADNIPAAGGALVVANHSGTIPLDALITGLVVHDDAGRRLRMLGADLVFSLPFVGELARKTGVTKACAEDAERMLAQGDLVGVWPEGFKGIGKPFSERYKLQRFGRGGFVTAALRTGVPIVPCSIVGAEEIYPMIANVPFLARVLGVPYVPVTPFFPWLGPLGLVPLPSKWLIEFGPPITTDSYPEGAAEDPMLVFNLTEPGPRDDPADALHPAGEEAWRVRLATPPAAPAPSGRWALGTRRRG